MDPCDRSQMVYGIDFAGFVSNNNNNSPLMNAYSQPTLPHLANGTNMAMNFNKYPQLSMNPMNSFQPQGMDSELYDLLVNANEKQFPVDLDLTNKVLNVERNNKEPEQEKPSNSFVESQKSNPRKRRLASNSLNQPALSSAYKGTDSGDELNGQEEQETEVNENQAKKSRRLVKNREAAQLFRQRQKAYIGDLEQKVDKLSTENVTLQSKVDLLSAENKLIKEQLGYLRNFISQVTMTLPLPYNQQQQVPQHIGFARKAPGFDPKYQ